MIHQFDFLVNHDGNYRYSVTIGIGIRKLNPTNYRYSQIVENHYLVQHYREPQSYHLRFQKEINFHNNHLSIPIQMSSNIFCNCQFGHMNMSKFIKQIFMYNCSYTYKLYKVHFLDWFIGL